MYLRPTGTVETREVEGLQRGGARAVASPQDERRRKKLRSCRRRGERENGAEEVEVRRGNAWTQASASSSRRLPSSRWRRRPERGRCTRATTGHGAMWGIWWGEKNEIGRRDRRSSRGESSPECPGGQLSMLDRGSTRNNNCVKYRDKAYDMPGSHGGMGEKSREGCDG
jgi:hypothetical protein